MASTGYEMALDSTLHQVYDVTAHEEPIDIQCPEEDAKGEKEDDEDDNEISYIGTTQVKPPRIINSLVFLLPTLTPKALLPSHLPPSPRRRNKSSSRWTTKLTQPKQRKLLSVRRGRLIRRWPVLPCTMRTTWLSRLCVSI